jgi:acetoacetate decarboxylase
MDRSNLAGRLDPYHSGFSQPVDSPLYEPGELGWAYRNSFFAGALYETDEDAFLNILPTGLRPAHSPPRVSLFGLECHTVGLGDFNEIKIEMLVELDGELHVYCPYIMVSALDGALAPDAAMAVGREVIGAPKKVGQVRFRRDAGQIQVTLERPIGKRLATISVAPKQQVSPASLGLDAGTPDLYLRVIPNVEGGPPSICQLVRYDIPKRFSSTETFVGSASVVFDSPSEEDPWYRLRPLNIIQGFAARFDLDIPPTARVVRDFVREAGNA